MARGGGTGRGKRGKPAAPAADPAEPPKASGLPLPSPSAGTNLVIADIVLRAAGGLLRDRLEKGLIVKSHGKDKADKLVGNRGLVSSLALYGASHLARRSPLGLAVVAGGLAAKVFYDRGRRLEKKRRAVKAPPPPKPPAPGDS